MQVRLTTPLTRQELAPLHAGDTVLLTGTVYTARDAAHARMNEALDRGEPLPFDIKGAAIYYVGPTPERPGCAIGAAGPTTSGRMDKFTPRLLDLGLTDAFRMFEQPEKSFSWWDYRMLGFQKNRGLRIDHILVSQALAPLVTACTVDRQPRKNKQPSDHAPVVATLQPL